MTNVTNWDAGDPHVPAGFETWGQAISTDVDAVAATVNTVATTGATESLAFASGNATQVHDVTMDQDCTFSFTGAPASGSLGTMTVIVRGAFTPTFPASVDWDSATAPTYAAPSVYEFVTVDGGTTVLGFAAGTGIG